MHPFVRAAALSFFVLSPAIGLCWDTAAIIPPGETPGPVVIERGRWLSDDNGWGQGRNGELFRLHDGRAIRAEQPSWFGVQRTISLADTTADGGALVYGPDCRLMRYTPDARVRWRSDPVCGELSVSASDDTSWGFRSPPQPADLPQLRHLAADGSALPLPADTLTQLAPLEVEPYTPLFRTSGGGVLHVGAVRNTAGLHEVRVLRLDAAGRVLWRWQSDSAWTGHSTRAAVADDGDMLISGCAGNGGDSTCSVLQVVRLSADGRVRWFNRALAPTGFMVSKPVATRDGGAAFMTASTSTQASTIVRLAPDGSVNWQRPVGELFGNQYPDFPFLGETADGGVIAVGIGSLTFEQGLRFVSLAADGSPRADRYIGFGIPIVDGATLRLANSTAPRLVRINELGERVPAGSADVTAATEMEYAASATGSDGAQFVLAIDRHASLDRPQPHFTLTKVGADGRIAWQRDTADEVVSARLGANAQRVCSFTRRARITAEGYGAKAGVIECLDATTGETLWSRVMAAHLPHAQELTVLPDNRLVTVRDGDDSHTVELLDAAGRTQQVVYGYQSALQIASSRNGYFAIALQATPTSSDAIVVYGPDAQRRYSVPRTAVNFAGGPVALTISDEGAVAVYGFDPGMNYPSAVVDGVVYATDPVANRSWRVALPPLQNNGWTATLQFAGDTVVVAQRPERYGSSISPNLPSTATRLIALDRNSGSQRWQQDSINVAALSHAMAPSIDDGRIVSIHGARYRLHIEQFDRRTGERVHDGWRDCAARECDPVQLINGADGRSRLIARVQTVENGSGVAVYTERGFDGPPIATRLDQPGIAGAWWSPYANGEGIAFDWLPASRTLFGAWFTYTDTGGNAPSQLRWYTLQANQVGVQATTLELPILETAGGNFDAGPPVAPRRVGTAHLTFSDCDNGTLRYVFDAATNGARAGTITLSRLSPATQPCVLADGTARPAAGARPPSHGFDARLSGTWFEPATPGQGLQMTVQPGGVFFAPWFAFDPADIANDAGRQHWFTLQGNLADARDGTASLVLVQTIGGTFDREPTYNAYAVGTATLRVIACDRATLDYHFDDVAVAGAFAARTGTLQLERAGGCAP